MLFRFRKILALVASAAAAGSSLAPGQTARDRAVELTAIVQESPKKIILNWNLTGFTLTDQRVYRRAKNATSSINWSQINVPALSAMTYEDTTMSLGVSYEYRVSRTFNGGPGNAHGYISAGIRVPVVADRGRVILLVDDTMAAPLATELTRFTSDLLGDGWTVIRQNVSRTATPASVRSAIQAIYGASPTNTVALILFGHVPVPYSGDNAMDGHTEHVGAWPTDVYYGDIDGSWIDTGVNNSSAADPRNRNIPGDGKFDQTVIQSDIELQVGRIDLADMPSAGVSETELLRRYLRRDHAYRHKLGDYASVLRRGLVDDDQWGFFGGECFAVSAWRSFTACVGAGNVFALDWFSTLQTQSYLWAYGCGPGSYKSSGGVGSTFDFTGSQSRAVFTMLFGSYFGDWDNSDAYLRAPLAGPEGSLGLVSCWAGRPHWFFHPMALGETTGYSARVTQNNRAIPTRGYDGNSGLRYNHIALLGDPTLRLYPFTPPANVVPTVTPSAVSLSWSGSPEAGLEGYLIARASSAAGPFVQLQSGLVTGTTFVDGSVTPGNSYVYLVRAVKLETSPTGSYLNSSQGAFSAAVVAGVASGPEIDVSGNGNAIVAGNSAPLAANGTEFGALEVPTSSTHSFTISNVGNAPLNMSGATVSGANAAEFSIVTPPPTTLAAGASATFQIRFQPLAVGARAATFSLTSNDANEATYAFAIGGTGTPAHAEIALYPPTLQRSIHAGSAVSEALSISNPAAGALHFNVSSSLSRYSARDSDSFGGPVYQWDDISSSGIEITGWENADDVITGPIGLGFPTFSFYGVSYNSVRICSNGFISFTDADQNSTNGALPALNAPANLVAALWDDLQLRAGSHVYFKASTDRFIVQFQNLARYDDQNADLTFQIVLLPSGEIFLQYQTLTATANSYTIGIQNTARDDGVLVVANSAYAHPGLAIRIRRPGLETWLSAAPTSGTVAAGGSQEIAVTLNGAGLTPGNYYADLFIDSNGQGAEALSVPVRLTIGNTPIENWRMLHFGSLEGEGENLAGDAANPDFDAANNLLEYALSRDPLASETTPLTATEINAAGYLQLRFTRDETRTDLRYLVEASGDLSGSWSAIASSVHGAPMRATGAHSAVETGASIKSVVVEDSILSSGSNSRFLRLRILRD